MKLFQLLISLFAICSLAVAGLIPVEEAGAIQARAGTTTTSTTTKKTSSTSTSTSKSSTSSKSSSTSKPSTSTVSTTSISIQSSSSSSKVSGSSTSTSASSSTSLVADASCTNGPLTRACWGNGFSIATNYDTSWPVTGKVVKYNLVIGNSTAAPDGVERIVLNINGQMPGPTLIANWGDTMEITVTNALTNNGTSIHFHGLRQWHSNAMDGVNGITECPLAPGQTKTYTFLCTQFGSSWYHSHYSAQYTDGVQGGIIINGPATANYDVDLGTMTIQDWYYETAFAYLPGLTLPPTADNGLLNGTMVNANGGGKYFQTTLTPGKKYRLRLINTSVDNHWKFSLDNHNLTVITADFVPIIPYSAQWIFIGIGERYDVIITANQVVDNYWFRAEVQSGCGTNSMEGNIKGIFHYAGASTANPTTTGWTYTQSCNDETQLVPYVKADVPSDTFAAQVGTLVTDLAFVINSNGQNIVQWNVNATAIDVDWDKPTLQYVIDGNTSYPTDLNLIALPSANTWSFWIVQSAADNVAQVPHPIHLHGHDFYVLGAGTGIFDKTTSSLKFTNPPRRDVAMLPAGGWLVIGFVTDNPGAWLMHCHIGWHIGEGLGVQFLERASDIVSTAAIPSDFESTCASWKTWYAQSPYQKIDSGL